MINNNYEYIQILPQLFDIRVNLWGDTANSKAPTDRSPITIMYEIKIITSQNRAQVWTRRHRR